MRKETTEHTEKGLQVEGNHEILEILEKALRAGLPEWEESTENTDHTEKGLHVKRNHKIHQILKKALRAGLPEEINARALILQIRSPRR